MKSVHNIIKGLVIWALFGAMSLFAQVTPIPSSATNGLDGGWSASGSTYYNASLGQFYPERSGFVEKAGDTIYLYSYGNNVDGNFRSGDARGTTFLWQQEQWFRATSIMFKLSRIDYATASSAWTYTNEKYSGYFMAGIGKENASSPLINLSTGYKPAAGSFIGMITAGLSGQNLKEDYTLTHFGKYDDTNAYSTMDTWAYSNRQGNIWNLWLRAAYEEVAWATNSEGQVTAVGRTNVCLYYSTNDRTNWVLLSSNNYNTSLTNGSGALTFYVAARSPQSNVHTTVQMQNLRIGIPSPVKFLNGVSNNAHIKSNFGFAVQTTNLGSSDIVFFTVESVTNTNVTVQYIINGVVSVNPTATEMALATNTNYITNYLYNLPVRYASESGGTSHSCPATVAGYVEGSLVRLGVEVNGSAYTYSNVHAVVDNFPDPKINASNVLEDNMVLKFFGDPSLWETNVNVTLENAVIMKLYTNGGLYGEINWDDLALSTTNIPWRLTPDNDGVYTVDVVAGNFTGNNREPEWVTNRFTNITVDNVSNAFIAIETETFAQTNSNVFITHRGFGPWETPIWVTTTNAYGSVGVSFQPMYLRTNYNSDGSVRTNNDGSIYTNFQNTGRSFSMTEVVENNVWQNFVFRWIQSNTSDAFYRITFTASNTNRESMSLTRYAHVDNNPAPYFTLQTNFPANNAIFTNFRYTDITNWLFPIALEITNIIYLEAAYADIFSPIAGTTITNYLIVASNLFGSTNTNIELEHFKGSTNLSWRMTKNSDVGGTNVFISTNWTLLTNQTNVSLPEIFVTTNGPVITTNLRTVTTNIVNNNVVIRLFGSNKAGEAHYMFYTNIWVDNVLIPEIGFDMSGRLFDAGITNLVKTSSSNVTLRFFQTNCEYFSIDTGNYAMRAVTNVVVLGTNESSAWPVLNDSVYLYDWNVPGLQAEGVHLFKLTAINNLKETFEQYYFLNVDNYSDPLIYMTYPLSNHHFGVGQNITFKVSTVNSNQVLGATLSNITFHIKGYPILSTNINTPDFTNSYTFTATVPFVPFGEQNLVAALTDQYGQVGNSSVSVVRFIGTEDLIMVHTNIIMDNAKFNTTNIMLPFKSEVANNLAQVPFALVSKLGDITNECTTYYLSNNDPTKYQARFQFSSSPAGKYSLLITDKWGSNAYYDETFVRVVDGISRKTTRVSAHFQVPSFGGEALVATVMRPFDVIEQEISASIFNSRGVKVATLMEEEAQTTDELFVNWDGLDVNGNEVDMGVYFVIIEIKIIDKDESVESESDSVGSSRFIKKPLVFIK